MRPAAPGLVLRRALLGWGLGHLALGRHMAGYGWLAAELTGLAVLVALVATLADTTWYLVPYVAGVAYVTAWAAQAILAYRAAQRTHGAVPPAATRSPAASIVWLGLPLLVWGAGYWLIAAEAASPAAVVDRLVTGWSEGRGPTAEAGTALAELETLCRAGELAPDCATRPGELFRDVRVRIEQRDAERALAVAEEVGFVRRPSRFLGVFETTELAPVPRDPILRLQLDAIPAALPGGIDLGARRWEIVSVEPAG